MPLFSQDEDDMAHRREPAHEASLRAAADEVRTWLTGQDDVADTFVDPDTPGTVAVRMADGQLIAVSVSTKHELSPPPALGPAAHQALAGRIRTWLAGKSGIDQAWAIRATSAVGADLSDGTGFIISVNPRS